MSIRHLNDDLSVISALSDEPNDVDGLSAGDLKAKFDLAGNTIKSYLNNSLIPDVESEIVNQVTATTVSSGNMPAWGLSGQALTKKSDQSFDWDFTTLHMIPTGGKTGQVLVKCSENDHDAQFRLPPALEWTLVQSFTTAGAYSWSAPDLNSGLPYEIGVFIIGGGGSGALAASNSAGWYAASGGASGFTKALRLMANPDDSFNIVVGAGGTSSQLTVPTGSTLNVIPGNAGGTSSFAGHTAAGGYGGKSYAATSGSNETCGAIGADGAQGSDAAIATIQIYAGNASQIRNHSVAPACGSPSTPLVYTTTGYFREIALFPGGRTTPDMCRNPFTEELMLAAGGSAGTYSQGWAQSGYVFEDGTHGGNGAFRNSNSGGEAIADAATAVGSGGGAAASREGSGTTVSSGAGADGGVFIYIRRIVL